MNHARGVPQGLIKQVHIDRLMKKVKKKAGCWELQSGICATDGYGNLYIGARGRIRKIRAHRASYAFHKGSIPAKILVCHTCDNRACINPDHLFLGDEAANFHDGMKKGRITPDKYLSLRHENRMLKGRLMHAHQEIKRLKRQLSNR